MVQRTSSDGSIIEPAGNRPQNDARASGYGGREEVSISWPKGLRIRGADVSRFAAPDVGPGDQPRAGLRLRQCRDRT